jgi:flagellar protein FlgJ
MQIQTSITRPVTANAGQADRSDAKLKKACRDFESVLVNQMLQKMRASVPKNDFFGSSKEEDTFQGMLDEKLADNISQTGVMKLGDLIYKQISDRLKNTSKVVGDVVDK